MTDERIKEEFEKWFNNITNLDNEIRFSTSVGHKNGDSAFYAGFRTAERLAKIEVLESVLDLVNCGRTESILQDVDSMLSELKEAGK